MAKKLNVKEMNANDFAERVSLAVRAVLSGKCTIAMSIVLYSKPDEFEMFNSLVRKYCACPFTNSLDGD